MKFVSALLLGLTVTAASTLTAGAQSAVLAPKGEVIDLKTVTTLNSGKAHDGDTFTMAENEGIIHHNAMLKGAVIEGHLENVTAAGPLHKASMNVIFDDIKFPDGTTEPISAKVKDPSEFVPKTHHLRDVAVIGASAVAGHIVSKKTGHKGGTIAGAAAGIALVTTMKSNIVVKPGQHVHLVLLQPIMQTSADATKM